MGNTASSNSVSHKVRKILLIGDSEVGKSAIIQRYLGRRFDKDSPQTIGLDVENAVMNVKGQEIHFQFWDTSGMVKNSALFEVYCQKSHCIIIVYDITNKESFNSVDHWRKEMEKYVLRGFKRILVGNKCDLRSDRSVDRSEAEKYAREHGMSFLETSARNGTNINMVFDSIVDGIDMLSVGREGELNKGCSIS